MDEDKKYLQVCASPGSSGIFCFDSSMEEESRRPISFAELGLPNSLAQRFQAWVAAVDTATSEESGAEGLVLAHALKEFLGPFSHVVFDDDYVYTELTWLKVKADFDCCLWDREGLGLSTKDLANEMGAPPDLVARINAWNTAHWQSHEDAAAFDRATHNVEGHEIAAAIKRHAGDRTTVIYYDMMRMEEEEVVLAVVP